MKKLVVLTLSLLGTGMVTTFVGCGSSEDTPPPADTDASIDGTADAAADGFIDTIDGSRADAAVCAPTGQACTTSGDCCSVNCVNHLCAQPLNQCKGPGVACATGKECCTFSCLGGKCADKQCVADTLACGTNADCCSGSCVPDGKGGGVCKPLSTTCRTSGNPCTTGDQCCSKLCNGGICSDGVSFCVQTGDACATNADCCGGNCTKAAGAALGVCGETASAPGATECLPKGTICGTTTGGVPDCGGTCCSRMCAPTGSAGGFTICQPPSGCSPTGEVCRIDADCCGSTGSPQPVDGPVVCAKASPTQEFGRCDNGTKCREPGSICKPKNQSCSAENNCCEPNGAPNPSYCNSDPDNCCRRDALGIPRCLLNANDCTSPIPAGSSCETSADCCGKPCVDHKCLAACVNLNGTCTTHADCCTGLPCVIPTGSTKGVCGGSYLPDGGVGPSPSPDGGTTSDGGGTGDGGSTTDGGIGPGPCALYGQTCSVNANCCDGVPCTNGTCHYTIK